jgi:hypothetical protein
MAVNFLRCSKHGMVKYRVVHECEVCAAENRCTQPTTTNSAMVQFLERVVNCLGSGCEIVPGSPIHDSALELLQKQHQ